MKTKTTAATLRTALSLAHHEPDLAVLARALINTDADVVVRADDITDFAVDVLKASDANALQTLIGDAGSFIITGTIQTVGVTLIATVDVPAGKFIQLSTFALKVNGATAWNDAATIAFKDGAGNVFATITKAALAGNAFVLPQTSGVTLGALWMTGGASDSGLFLTPSSTEATGSPVLIKVCGQFIDAP